MSHSQAYVTDVAYTPGYYRHQSPRHLQAACLLSGAAGLPAHRMERLSLLELGCGQGFGALVQAASNPGWQVTAIDFNPGHIAAAQAMADAAGLENIRFLHADLANLADTAALLAQVPEADMVTAHGVWSWVPEVVRQGIVRLLEARLRPGGLLHLSYNSLPGWQGMIGFQRLLREAGIRRAVRSDQQALAGLATLRQMAEAEVRHVAANPQVMAMLARMDRLPVSYLAHEYMNAAWDPCFHADVAAALAPAGMAFVGSADMMENFPDLMLTAPQRAIAAQFDDPHMFELVKDMCLERSFRQDIFQRGARRLGEGQREAALRDQVLALRRPAAEFVFSSRIPTGEAQLEPVFYQPVIDALAKGPSSIGALLDLPALHGRGRAAELLGMLVGTDQALPAGPVRALDTTAQARADRFNALAALELVDADNSQMNAALAAPALGTGLPCQVLELYVATRLQAPGAQPDIPAWTQELARRQPENEQAALGDALARLATERVPHWRSLGVLPP